MASKIVLIDDTDPKAEADETLRYGLDGITYEIDLSEANAAKFRGMFAKYIPVSRRAVPGGPTGARKPTKTAASPAGDEDNRAVRKWAQENGYEISDRGVIKAEIKAAYADAMRTGASSAPKTGAKGTKSATASPFSESAE